MQNDQHDQNDVPRLPSEDVVDRSTDIPDVAHDDERNAPGRDMDDTGDMSDDASEGDDLDPQMTD